MVRVFVRHRRRSLPPADHGPDGRRARHRGRPPGRPRARRLRSGRARLRDHAARARRTVAQGGGRRSGESRPGAALCHRDHDRAGSLGAVARARRDIAPVLRGARRPRARHPALGGAQAARQLASASHRRALRPLHDHPPRRERVRRVDRRGPGARRRGRERPARGGRRLRPRARLRALVAVLPPAGRGRPRFTSRSLVPLGLRPLRHLRRARRGGRRTRGGGRAHRPPRRRLAGRGRLRHRGPGQRVPRPAVGAARPDRVPAGVPAHAAAGRRPGHPAAPARGELDHVVRRRRRDRRHLRLDRRDHPPGRFSGVRRSRARAARARAARPQLPRRRPSRSA